MASWESNRSSRPTSRWQAPGIFLNVEFGVSFSQERRTHTTGVRYASRRMEDRLHEERMRLYRESGDHYAPSERPSELQQLATLGALMPDSWDSGYHRDYYAPEDQTRQQQRQRQLGINIREQHQRGTSAPPSLTDSVPPISPLEITYLPYIVPVQHTQSWPLEHTNSHSPSLERTNRPLPPTPSQFRLGEDSMPWSMPALYRSPEQSYRSIIDEASMTDDEAYREELRRIRDMEALHQAMALGREDEQRIEDPQRIRERESLHQAMMTVDSLPISHDAFEPCTWDGVEDTRSGPRSIGWAVSSRDTQPVSPLIPGPPPYVVSQWDMISQDRRSERPRSAYS